MPAGRRMRLSHWAILATASACVGCAQVDRLSPAGEVVEAGFRSVGTPLVTRDRADEPPADAVGSAQDSAAQRQQVRTLPPPADYGEPQRRRDTGAGDVVEGVTAISWPQELPSFLEVVFGEVLDLTFTYGPNVAEREELVNFSVARPVSRRELLDAVRLMLRDYGLAVVESDGVYRIVESEQFWRAAPSFVVSRSSRDTPADLRPVVQVVPLLSMDANSAVEFIRSSFEGDDDITISATPLDNTVIVRGLPSRVRNAVAMLASLDRPRFAGATIRSFSPRYWAAEDLVRAMNDALRAEGLQVSTMAGAQRPIILLAVPTSNEVLVFAESRSLSDRALFWARHLDDSAEFGDEPQIFLYPVENTDAANVADVVNAVFGGGAGPRRRSNESQSGQADSGPGGDTGQSPGVRSGRVVVDPFTNQLLFEGTATEWERMLPLFRRLDQQTPEVLIEVIIAEITLSNDTASGMEWLLSNVDIDDEEEADIGTLGGLGLQAGGLTVNLRGARARAVITALNESSEVRLLATPRLAARSGGQARINVGTEVPVIVSQAATDVQQGAGGTDILQSVEYRQTGNILTIEPIVFGGGRVDLNVTLEVSEAQSNPNQSIPSPIILNRSVETQLSLEDGAAAVIGGIIEQSQNNGTTGVPVLQNVPGLGRAFRTQTSEASRTELLLLVRPYLITGPDDRAALVEVLRQSLEAGDDAPLR